MDHKVLFDETAEEEVLYMRHPPTEPLPPTASLMPQPQVPIIDILQHLDDLQRPFAVSKIKDLYFKKN